MFVVKTRLHQNGYIMPVLLFTIVFLVTLLAIIGSLSLGTYNLATRQAYKVNAQLTADAGLDVALNELNLDADWAGTVGEITLLNTTNQRTTYEVEVLAGVTADKRVIAVTARTYSPASDVTPKITRKYQVDIQAVTSGTNISSVVTGVGGLIMNGNAKITGGDVIVNGAVTMSNQAQIGTQTNSVNLRVAYASCPQPADATFPQLCGGGYTDPITMGINSRIYADVQANNQVTSSGMFNPGLTASSGVPISTLSAYDRSLHSGATVYAATDIAVACANNNGSVTWPANIKIVGDLNMKNNCTITITGNVWITGNFETGVNGTIVVDDSLGTTRPIFMIDGVEGFELENNGEVVPNTDGTGIELRTFWSADATCSPDCTDVTGVDLANSQNITTLHLNSNANAPNSIFISQWSRVAVANNGALGAVSGQSIELRNGAIINFTASVPDSSNLTQTWVKRGYMRVFN